MAIDNSDWEAVNGPSTAPSSDSDWEAIPQTPPTSPRKPNAASDPLIHLNPNAQGVFQPSQFSSGTGMIEPAADTGDYGLTRALGVDLPSDVGRHLDSAGNALRDVAAAYAFEAVGDPESQAKQLGITGEQLRKLGFHTQDPDSELKPFEEGMRSLPTVPRAISRGAEGLITSAPRMAAAAIDPALGALAFGSTANGFDPKQAAIAFALPLIGKEAGAITEAIAKKAGVSSDAALTAFNKLGGATGAAGLIGADQLREISALPADKRKDALVEAAGNVGSMFLLGTLGERETPSTPQETTTQFVKDFAEGKVKSTPDSTKVGMAAKSIADLDALAKARTDITAEGGMAKLVEKMDAEKDPEKKNAMARVLGGIQFPREAIEAATNTGSHVEEESRPEWKLGDRPLDWRKNPEVADWLIKNAQKIGIKLPDELVKQAANPTPEIIGMGGATPSELPGSGGGEDKYGIAERVRQQREAAGQTAPTNPGTGISAPDSVTHGRDLLAKDPNAAELAMAEFEKTKAVSSDAMALGRAKGEELARTARRTEEKFGTDSDEYRAAWKALSDWDGRMKGMQTEWHRSGMAQQGETDIDTGSFTGLQRAYTADTGKEFTPDQAKTAKDIASKATTATAEAETAKQKLFDHLNSDSEGGSAADKKALDAANKTVREAAARLAEAETKERVAQSERDKQAARIQQQEAKKALDAANKTVREAAARLAEAETKERVAQSERDKQAARIQQQEAKKALDAANKAVRDAAIKAAKSAEKERVGKADVSANVWKKAKEYIDKGMDDFDDIRNKIATDLGMKVGDVTKALAKTKQAKFLADELWKKQQTARRLDQQAKRWLKQTAIPGYKRALQSIPRALFSLKVGFHGTVALGTHAPMVAFQPRFWADYVRDFGKMYKMVASPAYYEMQIQDLQRRPNYTTARRAGLVNDPHTAEDFNSPDISKWAEKMTGMGNRGYTVLKILRQDMFDQMWGQLPDSAKTLGKGKSSKEINEMAAAIADGINHATGVVKVNAPKGANLAFFAPRLEMSRVAWLAADPAKAVDTFARWKNATDAEKQFAINQVKEKAWVVGTLTAMLAVNQGVLDASGSKQKINFTDPMKSDFLKFKAAGMDLSYGNAMLSMARLPVRLYKIRTSDGGKLKNLVYPDEDTYSVLGEYGRSQLSPFASLATTLWLKGDWQNRPLPDSNRPVPKRLKALGVAPYTWGEFWSEQALPIPAEEAAREVWRYGMGMSPEQIKAAAKALATISVMGATGARLTDDVRAK